MSIQTGMVQSRVVPRRRFLQKAGVVAAGLGLTKGSLSAGPSARPAAVKPQRRDEAAKSYTGKRPEDYRVILQDIGDPLTRMSWPPSPEKLVEASVGPLRDSAIDVYAYGIHHAGGTTHCSKVYPVVGDDQ